ncbi:MAG TPA: hypothetical protein VF808_14575 [Ktedonobacterales bacterium]
MSAASPGASVNNVLAITGLVAPDQFEGELLQPDEAEPFSAFRRGVISESRVVEAERLVILTGVARIIEA